MPKKIKDQTPTHDEHIVEGDTPPAVEPTGYTRFADEEAALAAEGAEKPAPVRKDHPHAHYETFAPEGDHKGVKRNLRGWKRDKPDHRDYLFRDVLGVHTLAPLPAKFSLRTLSPPVYDQGDEGSCTAFSCDSIVTTNQMRQNLPAFELGHNFTYYNTRQIEGTTGEDAGASCRDVLVAYSKFGFCSAKTYPYDDTQALAKPGQAAYEEGLKNIVSPVQYARVGQNLQELKTAISLGLPVFLGMDVFRQLQSAQAAKTGVLTMPSRRERPIGGHAITYVGWDDTKQMFEWRNSWGEEWGDAGYGWLPYAMALNSQISSDFWVLRTLTPAKKDGQDQGAAVNV